MKARTPTAIVMLWACLVCLQGAETEAGQFSGLIMNSPFGQPGPAPGAAEGNEPSVLEFRGVFADKGEYFFSIHETASRSSQWVSLKETGQPYVVESYDSAAGQIQVRFRNQMMKLTLKRAQVVVQVAQILPVAGPTASGPTPVLATNSTPADEASRLAVMAAEIRRRRALRTPSAQPPMPGSSPQPPPPTTLP